MRENYSSKHEIWFKTSTIQSEDNNQNRSADFDYKEIEIEYKGDNSPIHHLGTSRTGTFLSEDLF